MWFLIKGPTGKLSNQSLDDRTKLLTKGCSPRIKAPKVGEEEVEEKEKAQRIFRKNLFKQTNCKKSNEKLANMTVWKRPLASLRQADI